MEFLKCFVDECFINKAQFDAGFEHGLILKDGAVPAIKDPGHDSELQMVSRDGRIDPKVSILSILMLYRKDRSSHKNIDSKVHFFNHYFYLLKNSVHKISF